MESIRAASKELFLPDLDRIREVNKHINAILTVTNQRLGDVNLHLVEQSRRIDALRDALTGRIDETNNRLDRLDQMVARREEHVLLADRVAHLERDLAEIKQKLAA